MARTKSEHRDYIASEHWQQRRKAFLADHDRCYRCDMPRWLSAIVYDQDLNVHHRNYQNLGAEPDSDLRALCPRCHELESLGRSSLRELTAVRCSECDRTHYDPYSGLCPICRYRERPPEEIARQKREDDASKTELVLQNIAEVEGVQTNGALTFEDVLRQAAKMSDPNNSLVHPGSDVRRGAELLVAALEKGNTLMAIGALDMIVKKLIVQLESELGYSCHNALKLFVMARTLLFTAAEKQQTSAATTTQT